MNKRFPLYVLVGLLVASVFASCKHDNQEDTINNVSSSSSTLISAFSLGKNNKVLYNLDSVHFAINQDQGLIYNADSLPVRTDVSHLTVNVTFPTTVSKAEFHVTGGKVMKDTTINYTSSTKDSIDFTGHVDLVVTANDNKTTRTYNIKVNVHEQEPDTLFWDKASRRDLPGVYGTVIAEKMVQQGSSYIALVQQGAGFTISTASSPGQGTWTKTASSVPFTPVVKSFAATQDAIYLLDIAGELYRSTDMGSSWVDCGIAWYSILGGYGDKLLGVINDSGVYKHDEYPRSAGFALKELENNFPIAGASPLVKASNEWVAAQQSFVVGGFTKTGELTSATWGYDGTTWAELSNSSTTSSTLPGIQEPVIVPYYSYQVDTVSIKATKRVTWLLMGGRLGDGSLNKVTYVSYNQGISWTAGASTLQLPSYIAPFYKAQAFVTVESRTKAKTLVAQPVTSWDCPYIYLVGGVNASGEVYNNIWKGVINRLSFKPVY